MQTTCAESPWCTGRGQVVLLLRKVWSAQLSPSAVKVTSLGLCEVKLPVIWTESSLQDLRITGLGPIFTETCQLHFVHATTSCSRPIACLCKPTTCLEQLIGHTSAPANVNLCLACGGTRGRVPPVQQPEAWVQPGQVTPGQGGLSVHPRLLRSGLVRHMNAYCLPDALTQSFWPATVPEGLRK